MHIEHLVRVRQQTCRLYVTKLNDASERKERHKKRGRPHESDMHI